MKLYTFFYNFHLTFSIQKARFECFAILVFPITSQSFVIGCCVLLVGSFFDLFSCTLICSSKLWNCLPPFLTYWPSANLEIIGSWASFICYCSNTCNCSLFLVCSNLLSNIDHTNLLCCNTNNHIMCAHFYFQLQPLILCFLLIWLM